MMDRLEDLLRQRQACVTELEDAKSARDRAFSWVIDPLNDTILRYRARITALDLLIAEARKGEAA